MNTHSKSQNDENLQTPDAVKALNALHQLGLGEVGYIRMMHFADVVSLFPDADVGELPEKGEFYALMHANGQPIVLTDTFAAALGTAQESELQVATVH